MNDRTLDHSQDAISRDKSRRHIRNLASVVVALMVTSAGAGALAEHVSAAKGTKAPVTVVRDTRGRDGGGSNLPRSVPQCTSTSPRPRVVLLTLRTPSACAHAPVLVSRQL